MQARSHCQHLAAVHKAAKNAALVLAGVEAPAWNDLFRNSF